MSTVSFYKIYLVEDEAIISFGQVAGSNVIEPKYILQSFFFFETNDIVCIEALNEPPSDKMFDDFVSVAKRTANFSRCCQNAVVLVALVNRKEKQVLITNVLQRWLPCTIVEVENKKHDKEWSIRTMIEWAGCVSKVRRAADDLKCFDEPTCAAFLFLNIKLIDLEGQVIRVYMGFVGCRESVKKLLETECLFSYFKSFFQFGEHLEIMNVAFMPEIRQRDSCSSESNIYHTIEEEKWRVDLEGLRVHAFVSEFDDSRLVLNDKLFEFNKTYFINIEKIIL